MFENLTKALVYDPKEITGVVDQLDKYKDEMPVVLEKCLSIFDGIDYTIDGYESLISVQDCLASNEV